MAGDNLISSSRIRECLRQGDVGKARDMLGRAYALARRSSPATGAGARSASRLPISVWDEQLVPANGVYATWASLGDDRYMAATNIGLRPTFAGDKP